MQSRGHLKCAEARWLSPLVPTDLGFWSRQGTAVVTDSARYLSPAPSKHAGCRQLRPPRRLT